MSATVKGLRRARPNVRFHPLRTLVLVPGWRWRHGEARFPRSA
jgi:hypothetical protein